MAHLMAFLMVLGTVLQSALVLALQLVRRKGLWWVLGVVQVKAPQLDLEMVLVRDWGWALNSELQMAGALALKWGPGKAQTTARC